MTAAEEKRPGLYIHIPFCRSRCGYCTFVSSEYDKDVADRYITALHSEYKARQIFTKSNPPSTLFIGGGTPSMLSAAQLDTLLSGLPVATEEATCEVNPESISPDKLRVLAGHGINRLSIGIQTFSSEGLRLLGRPHDYGSAMMAVEMAKKEGFTNISIDLINCWPGQEQDLLKNDIVISYNLGIQHISLYSMILEPCCSDYSRLSGLMSMYTDPEEREKKYWDIIEQLLESNKFIHYETSNYALSDFYCRHNVYTWQGGEYLGIGMAAHSHINGRRFSNTDKIDLYLSHSSDPGTLEVMSEKLVGKEKAKECAVFWLRLFEGIDTQAFSKRTGYTLEQVYGAVLTDMINHGYLERDGSLRYIRVPREKQIVLDSILVELI